MKKSISLTILTTLVLTSSLFGQNILLNFGGRSYSGTNAPGHAAGDLTGTSWNTVAVDTASGIVDENGNATDVALNFGITTTDTSTTLNYDGDTKAYDYTMAADVSDQFKTLFDTNLGTSNSIRDSGANYGVGLAITGLDPGTYVFYLTSFRGDSEGNSRADFDIYAGASSGGIEDFSSYSVGTIQNLSNISTWTYGSNYMSGTFTIDGTNDTFSIMSNGATTIGALTSLEIAAVPESSDYGLLAGLSMALLCVLYRRRK